jgi:hypothetical protein
MTKRPTPSEIAADRAALRAIEELPDYAPSNQAHSLAMLQQMEATLVAAGESKEQARLAFERARRAYVLACSVEGETGQGFRDLMRAAKTEVRVQFGDDSHAIDAIGWTRKSDRKRPGRKVPVAG